MLETSDRPIDLTTTWEEARPLLDAFGPAELAEVRQKAIRRYQEAGLPTTKDEEFKYTPLLALKAMPLEAARGATVFRDELKSTAIGSVEAITLAFVNGESAPELEVEGALPEGVVLKPLAEALEERPDLVLPHLAKVNSLDGKLGSTNDERFRWLNTAHLSDGAFLYVPTGVGLPHLIHLLFASKAERPIAAHPRVLIVLEPGASAKVLESHVGLGGAYFSNAVTEIVLAEGARLEHIRMQGESSGAVHVGIVAVDQARDSVLNSISAQLGGQEARLDYNVYVGGERAETWLNGAYAATGSQTIDNHTRLDHAVPNCNSFEVYKGILGGKAIGVFNGKIFVYKDAQKTDAKQTNQALLLSPTAQVNTKPQLEIFADDVKCTHGATVGQLREDALFYLRARGVPKRQAQALLVYAFAAEVLEKISVDSVREALEKALYDKLHEDADFHASGA